MRGIGAIRRLVPASPYLTRWTEFFGPDRPDWERLNFAIRPLPANHHFSLNRPAKPSHPSPATREDGVISEQVFESLFNEVDGVFRS